MEYKIISDGSCDLNPEDAKEMGVHVVPFYVSFDGENYKKEMEDIAVRDFYQEMLDNPKVFPKSSLPSITDFEDVFRKYVEEGKAIICICITTKFSGSFNSATNAKNIILEEYPDAKIKVIDSNINTVLQGLFVKESVRMQQDGISYEDNIANLEKIKETGRILFTIGSIDYLKNGGRIGKVIGVAGSALGIRPIIILKEGEIFTGGIARSRNKSIQKVLDQIENHFAETGESPDDYAITVGYGYDYDEAVEFKGKVLELLGKISNVKDIKIEQIGATIGVHTGPHPIGVGLIKKYDR